MVKYLLLSLTLIVLISCQGNKQKQVVKSDQPVAIDSAKISLILNQLLAKYTDLMNFKDEAKFIEVGFGIGGPYNEWLKDIQKMSDKYDSDLLSAGKGVLFGDLEMLGYEYIQTKGKENDYTKFCHEAYANATK
jgi:hypothetical protein